MNIPLNIDWQQILLHVFNFSILVGGLYLLLFKPVKSFMAKREKHYADMESAAVAREKDTEELKAEIQNKVEVAGLEILEARITHLAYAPEIAAAMLQRQQASAIIDARKMIVEGAVGMVEMALDRLSENKTVELDEERKAAMVSNLLVVLCGNRDAQPVVNSGSLY